MKTDRRTGKRMGKQTGRKTGKKTDPGVYPVQSYIPQRVMEKMYESASSPMCCAIFSRDLIEWIKKAHNNR